MNLHRAVFTRVALLTSILVTALAVIFCIGIVKHHRSDTKKTYEFIAELIATRIERALHWDDRIVVKEALSSIVDDDPLVCYAAIAVDGNPIEWAITGTSIPATVWSHPLAFSTEPCNFEVVDDEGHIIFNITKPITSTGTVLHLGLLQSRVDRHKHGFLMAIACISAGCLIAGIMLAFVFARRAIREVELLSQVIIDTGSRDEEPEFSTSDAPTEITELITSFKRLIGERRESETRLRESHHFLETAINALSHPFYVISVKDFRIVLANRAAQDREIIPEAKCYEITHGRQTPCDGVDHPCPIQDVMKTRTNVVVEHLHSSDNGEPRYCEIHAHPIYDENGEVARMIEYSIDITDRRLAELELEDSERRYRALIEASPDKHLRVNRDGAILDFKGDTTELIMSPDSIIGSHISDLPVSPGTRNALTSIIERAIDSGTLHLHEYDVERIQGTRSFEARATKSGPDEALCVVRDITQRKEAEDGLRRKNRELALLNWVISAASSNMEVDEVLKTTCYELAHTLSLPHVAAALIDNDGKSLEIEAEFRSDGTKTISGHRIELDDSNVYQRDLQRLQPFISCDAKNDPRVQSLWPLLRDLNADTLTLVPLAIEGSFGGLLLLISPERRQFSNDELGLVLNVAGQLSSSLAIAQLNQDRQRLESAINQIEDSVIITDVDGTIVDVNPFFERLTGYSRSETIGKKPSILRSGVHNDEFYAELWSTILQGDAWHGRFVNRKKDGSLYTEDASITPVRGPDGTVVNFIAVKRDITEIEHLEKQYLQAQKMESVGRLAGGIAHDFNNLLGAIMGYAEISLMQIDESHPLFEAISEIVHACDHAAGLTRQLLTFARKQKTEKTLLSLNTVITNVQRVFKHLIGEDINVKISLDEDLGSICVDPSQIEQVVLNLIVNAKEAMPTGGTLTITTANVELDKAMLFNGTTIEAGHYSQMIVRDTGHGIAHTALDHIFEPFFSTKETGKGTGLGLATSFGIVTEAGGLIRVDSELGVGTIFGVFLPNAGTTCCQTSTVLGHANYQAQLPAGRGETILLAEDDARIRNLASRVLRDKGYEVLEAEDGEMALTIASEHDGTIDLVITDVVMPKIHGTEIIPMLRAEHPSIKVLFITGYMDIAIHIEKDQDKDCQLLEKPFAPSTLITKVREMLE